MHPLLRLIKEFEVILFAILLFIVWIVGAVGFFDILGMQGTLRGYGDALYLSLQLFVLDSGYVASETFSWPLEFARWAAPATLAAATVRAALSLAHDHFKRFRLKFVNNHIVVCGLGQKGFQFINSIQSLDGQNSTIVVVEIDAGNTLLDDIRQRENIIILIGDASDNAVLEQAKVAHASRLVALTSDDKTNLAIAQLTFDLHQRGAHENHLLECMILINDDAVRRIFYEHPLFSHSHGNFDARMFDLYERGARRLLQKHFASHLINLAAPKNEVSQHHLLLVGFGRIGKNLAIQAARIGCYPDSRRLRVTVLDREATFLSKKIFNEMPAINHLLDIRFYPIDAALLPASPEDFARLEYFVPGEAAPITSQKPLEKPDATYVCLGDELVNFMVANRISQWLASYEQETEVVACLAEGGNITKLIAQAGVEPSKVKVVPNEFLKHICTYDVIFNTRIEQLAKAIHHDYVRSQLVTLSRDAVSAQSLSLGINADDAWGSLSALLKNFEAEMSRDGFAPDIALFGRMLGNPSIVHWSELSEELKDANREQAEHIGSKLALVNCKAMPSASLSDSGDSLNSREIETLARVEHSRWMADKIIQGWRFGQKRDNTLKLNPLLVPYDDLDQPNKEKDIATITNIPRLLKLNGEIIVREPYAKEDL